MSSVICSDGCNYGELNIIDNIICYNSIENSNILNLKLEQVSQCVVPASNRDEVEIHFHETDDKGHQKDDILAQITFHFPADESEENEDETKAEEFKKKVVDTGVIRSVTGDVIVEFSKEQANFVTPR